MISGFCVRGFGFPKPILKSIVIMFAITLELLLIILVVIVIRILVILIVVRIAMILNPNL